jgi:PAS domain S-box-containing protein
MMRASAASAPRARPAFSIRLLMMLFAAAVTLPLLLYLAVLIAHSFQSARQIAEEDRLHAARQAAQDVDTRLAAIRAGIALSAGSTALARGDFAGYAAELRLAVGIQGVQAATLLDTQGAVVPGLDRIMGALPDAAGLAARAQGLHGGVGDLADGPVPGTAMFHVSGTATFPGGEPGMVVFRIGPDIFAPLGAGNALAKGEVLTVRDRAGRLLWRSAPHVVGEPLPQNLVQAMAGREDGVLPDAETHWGGRRSVGFAHAPVSGFLVTSGVPSRDHYDSMPLGAEGTLLLAAASIGGSFGLAAFLGRYVRRAFRRAVLGRTALGIGLLEADALGTELRADRDALLGTLSTVALLELRRLDIGDGLRLHASPSALFQSFMGIGPQDIESATDIVQMVEEPDRRALEAALAGALAHGGSFSQEVHRLHPVHGPRLLRMVGATDIDRNGRIRRLVLTVEDITGAQRAARALMEREARFRLALDAAGLGLFTIDLATGAIERSPEYLRMMGRPETEAEIHRPFDPRDIHPDDLATVQAALNGWRQGDAEGRQRISYRAMHRDGSVRHLETLPTVEHGPDGTPARIVGAVRDVTEMRLAAQAIQNSEARLRLATEAADLGIWDIDLATGERVISPRMWGMFGMEPREGAPAREELLAVVFPQDHATLRRAWADIAAARDVIDYEYRIRLPGGEIRHLHGHGRTLRGEDGTALRITGICADVTERRQAEQALAERSAILELAMDTADLGVWHRDLDSDTGTMSPRIWTMLGLEPREGWHTREEFLAAVHPDDRARVERDWVATPPTQHGVPYDIEYRVQWPDGSVRHISSRRMLVMASEMNVRRVIGIHADVTQARRATQALADSEARMRLAVDAADIGVFEFNAAGEGYWSERAWRMRGLEPREGIPHPAETKALVHPEDVESAMRNLQLQFHNPNGAGNEHEFRVVWADGTIRHLMSRSITQRDAEGALVKVVGINIDITERRRVDDMIRRSEARFRLAIETAQLGVWDYDPSTAETVWSARMWDMRGLPAEDAPVTIDEIIASTHPQDRARIEAAVRAQRAGERPGVIDHEYRVMHPNGSERLVRSRSVAVHDACGRLQRIIGVNHDITDQRAAETALRENEALFRLAAETASLGVYQINLPDRTGTWSELMYTMRGLAPRPGMPPIDAMLAMVHPDDRDTVFANMKAHSTREVGEVSQYEFRIVRPDGTVRQLLARAFSMRDEEGVLRKVIGINQDITDQRAAETALRENEAMFRLAIETASLGVYQMNMPDRTGIWSERMYTMRGLTPRPGMPGIDEMMEMIHPDDRQALLANRIGHRTRASGDVSEYEFRVIWPDGSVHHLLARAFPLRADDGTLLKIVGVNLDITGQKRVEQELRDAATRFELATKAAGLAVWEWHVPSNARHWSADMWALRGLPPRAEAPTDLEVMATIHPDDRPAAEHFVAAVRENPGTPAEGEYRVLMPDRTARYINLRTAALRDADGQVVRVTGVASDVTERRIATRALQESESLFRLAAEAASQGVWDQDIRTGHVRWSHRMWLIYGILPCDNPPSRAEWEALLHPDDRAEVLATFKRLLAHPGDHVESGQYRIVWPGGGIRHLEMRAMSVHDETGALVRLIGVVVDITEVQELRAQATIAGNVATLAQLAGGIAHELAQPLQAMIATADTAALRLTLSDDADTIGTVRNRLTHISALAARAGKTIQHLLAFSRGTSTSGVSLLSDAVAGTLELVGRNLTHAQVFVSVDVPADLPLVLGGLVEIEQVLVNLLLNARDAMEGQAERRVEIRAYQQARDVVLSITDTGTGIPPELLSRIFDPFFTTKPSGKGTGLGLAISRKTMVAIGGSIEARNTGTGTEFILVFPTMELAD